MTEPERNLNELEVINSIAKTIEEYLAEILYIIENLPTDAWLDAHDASADEARERIKELGNKIREDRAKDLANAAQIGTEPHV